MLRTSNRKVTTALLCAASVLCLSGAALALDRTVKVEADDASYGYNVKFYEDFNDGQLKEGWEYVYGEISDDAVTYGKNAGGKMLYNTGAKEYAYSVDITMGTSEDDATNPNVHMPILVADPEIPESKSGDTWRITDGITVNFQETKVVLYDFSEGTASTISAATTSYGALVKFGVQQTWTVVVGRNIQIYVDGVFFTGVATPKAYTSGGFTSFYCGIGAGKISAVDTTFTYDNFVVYEKDEANTANTATTSLYDFSNIVKDDTSGVIKATSTVKGTQFDVTTGAEDKVTSYWLNKNETFGDFTMAIKVDSLYLSSSCGLYFGASEKDGKVSGYRLAFGNGKGEGNGTKWRMYKVTDETNETTTNPSFISNFGNNKGFELDAYLYLTVSGKTVTVTYTTYDTAEVMTETYTADEDITGYIGFRVVDTNASNAYYATFSMAMNALSTEDTSVMTKATLTSTNDTKYVYSVRKNTTLGLDDLGLNAVAFVNDDESLTEKALSVGEKAVEGKVLTVNSFAVEGAAIRVIDPAGIRFKTAISKADVTALTKYVTVKEVGTLLIPTSKLGNGALTVDTATVVKATVSVVNEVSGTDMYKYWGTLTKIPATDYETEISACGYMKITLTLDGKEVTRYVYTDVLARSLAGVAQAALADEDGGYSDEQRAQLEIYAAGNKAAE